MNHLVIARFGNTNLTGPEIRLLSRIGTEKSLCCRLGTIGMVSIIQTNLTSQEVSQLYQEMAKTNNDSYPVIIGRLGETIFDFGQNVPAYYEMIDQFKLSIGESPTICTIDQLLDKIGQVGYDALSDYEKNLLDDLSK